LGGTARIMDYKKMFVGIASLTIWTASILSFLISQSSKSISQNALTYWIFSVMLGNMMLTGILVILVLMKQWMAMDIPKITKEEIRQVPISKQPKQPPQKSQARQPRKGTEIHRPRSKREKSSESNQPPTGTPPKVTAPEEWKEDKEWE
jgi:cytoskeletal protein RodZ